MKSEVYIVNLVKTSLRVRTIIAGLIKHSVFPDRVSLLLSLSLPETLEILAKRLQCDQDQAFVKLAEHVKRDMGGRFSRPFTVKHLHDLATVQTRRHLSQVLDCDPLEVLDELFDVHAMFDTLFKVEPAEVILQLMLKIEKDSIFPSASTAFCKILDVHQKLAEHYQIGDFGWGSLLDEHQWLRIKALTRLRNYAMSQGFSQAKGSDLLSVVVDSHSYKGDVDEVHLDTIGIIYIQQRLAWIVRQLREHAHDLVSEIVASIPSYSSLARLQPHIELYELKAPANAWRTVFNTVKSQIPSIKAKFPNLKISSTNKPGTPKSTSYLKVRTEKIDSKPPFWKFWEKPKVIAAKLIVSCEVEEHDLLVDILICSNVPSAQIASLEKFFTTLQGGVIAQSRVPDIGAQLLKDQHVPMDTFQNALIKACAQLQPELIRSLILAGVHLPIQLNTAWSERLNHQVSITPRKYNEDIIYPKSRTEILAQIRKDYINRDNVQIIE